MLSTRRVNVHAGNVLHVSHQFFGEGLLCQVVHLHLTLRSDKEVGLDGMEHGALNVALGFLEGILCLLSRKLMNIYCLGLGYQLLGYFGLSFTCRTDSGKIIPFVVPGNHFQRILRHLEFNYQAQA